MTTTRRDIVGVVLAGGASRRMGGVAKATLHLDGETLAARAVRRLSTQVTDVLVNANDPGCEGLGAGVVPDAFPDRRGPLAGILAGMEWCRSRRSGASHLASVAVDTPFFPDDLVGRLAAETSGDRIALVEAGGRPQPTFGLWPVALADELRSFLERDGSRKVLHFVDSVGGYDGVAFDEAAFENVNTPEELEAARRRAA